MPELLITPPAGECIHVDEARNDRRLDDRADDAKLKSLIVAARQAVEAKTRQQLLHARWQLVLDGFPCGALKLPHTPLARVESIEYLAMDDSWQTLPESEYVVNHGLMPATIAPRFGKVWPIPLPQSASVKVTYSAGYASPFATGGALASNELRVTGPVAWEVGAVVQFYNSGGQLPTPLSADALYRIASANGSVYTLADDAGNAVTFTQPGTGRSFIGVVPDGIRSWMLLRVGAMYENREEIAVGQRLVVLTLPHVDGLLDPFMVIV